jgi:phosphatidate phosphatase APP1
MATETSVETLENLHSSMQPNVASRYKTQNTGKKCKRGLSGDCLPAETNQIRVCKDVINLNKTGNVSITGALGSFRGTTVAVEKQ